MGGLYLSVCAESYDEYLRDIAGAAGATTASAYELIHTAVAGTIAVTVDGVAVTTGWSYDAATNVITFNARPDSAAIVEISYAARGEC